MNGAQQQRFANVCRVIVRKWKTAVKPFRVLIMHLKPRCSTLVPTRAPASILSIRCRAWCHVFILLTDLRTRGMQTGDLLFFSLTPLFFFMLFYFILFYTSIKLIGNNTQTHLHTEKSATSKQIINNTEKPEQWGARNPGSGRAEQNKPQNVCFQLPPITLNTTHTNLTLSMIFTPFLAQI